MSAAIFSMSFTVISLSALKQCIIVQLVVFAASIGVPKKLNCSIFVLEKPEFFTMALFMDPHFNSALMNLAPVKSQKLNSIHLFSKNFHIGTQPHAIFIFETGQCDIIEFLSMLNSFSVGQIT